MGDQPVARPSTCTDIINAHRYLPQVGFESMIPVFEPAKTVHALDRPNTVIGTRNVSTKNYKCPLILLSVVL
jgi:hypothetical protein